MTDLLSKLCSFVRGIFSEADGTPSASRIIMCGLAAVSSYCLILLFRAIPTLAPERLSVVMASLPIIIGAFAGFLSSPYGVNKVGQTLSNIFKKEDKPQ